MKRENLIVILFSVLSLLAFAANSILNRAGVADGAIGPASFAAVRVASAFVVLAAVFWIKERRLPAKPVHWLGPVGLLIYILGFSFGYLNLNAGFGALLLFGAVQIAMFVASWLRGHTPGAGAGARAPFRTDDDSHVVAWHSVRGALRCQRRTVACGVRHVGAHQCRQGRH